MPNVRAPSPDGYSECGYTKAPSDTCTSSILGWLVFNRIVPDARTTSADGCSECGYSTKATSDTCTSSTLCWLL